MPDVIGIDNPVFDISISVDKMPVSNENKKMQFFCIQSGGKVSTAIAALGRLGASCGIYGMVDSGFRGKFCYDDMVRHNVDVSHLLINPSANTGTCVTIADKEKKGRSILGKGAYFDEIDEIDWEYLRTAKYIHFCHVNDYTLKIMKFARENRIKVVFDADWYSDSLDGNLDKIDYFIASEFTYKHIFGGSEEYERNLKLLSRRGPSTVIVTLGSKGSVAYEDGNFFKRGVYDVDVVDSTGAGDVFHGAYIFGLVKGWSIENILDFATAVSSIKCTAIGGRAGIPTYDMTKKFMETSVIDMEEINKRVEFYERMIY